MMEIVRQPKPPLRYVCPVCGANLGGNGGGQAVPAEVVCAQCGTRCACHGGDTAGANAEARPAVKVVPTGMAATIQLD